MNRIPFDLDSVRLARQLKAAASTTAGADDSLTNNARTARVVATFATVPDVVLARLERLLIEREQLKQMISTLLQRVA